MLPPRVRTWAAAVWTAPILDICHFHSVYKEEPAGGDYKRLGSGLNDIGASLEQSSFGFRANSSLTGQRSMPKSGTQICVNPRRGIMFIATPPVTGSGQPKRGAMFRHDSVDCAPAGAGLCFWAAATINIAPPAGVADRLPSSSRPRWHHPFGWARFVRKVDNDKNLTFPGLDPPQLDCEQ